MSDLHLFFYGTLMSRHERGHFLDGLARPIGRGTIRGDLFDVGYFPAFMPGDGVVRGEVWQAYSPDALADVLKITDSIEGYRADRPAHSMYVRETVDLLSFDTFDRYAGGTPVRGHTRPTTVQTYRWNGRPLPRRIASGCWATHRSALDTLERYAMGAMA